MGTFITAAVLIGIVTLIIRKMIKDKKAHKNSCGDGCQNCKGSCH